MAEEEEAAPAPAPAPAPPLSEELEFYSKFTRPLIFALPEPKDRVLAASWVKKIKEDQNINEKLRTDYIKLLLFALQRKKLTGIFSDDPTNYEQLEEFPDEYDLNSMAQELIEMEIKERRNRIKKQLQGKVGDFPPYTTDISADLREYVAAQDIPGFGVHCYYAISRDPITNWQKADKGIYPKPAKSAVDTRGPLPPGMHSTASGTCIDCPGPEGTEPCKPRTADSPEEPEKKKKKSKKKLGDAPPVKPLVSGPQPEDETDRKPPTWSSNLMDVIERPRLSSGKGSNAKDQQRMRRFSEACDSDFDEDYDEIERALKDFKRGEIIEGKRKRKKRYKSDEDDDDNDEEDTQEDAQIEYDFENFFDINDTEYEQELREDSILVKYFRDTLNQRTIQRGINNVSNNIRGTLPAQSRIPLTTPKPSVSPRRMNISPPAYTMDDKLLPRDLTKETDTNSPKPTCSYACSGRDPEMDKIFQEASALAAAINDDLEADFSDSEETDDHEQPPQHMEPQLPPVEPMRPITRGSSAAHKIFADVVPPLLEPLQSGPCVQTCDEFYDDDNECPPPLPDAGRICKEIQPQGRRSRQQDVPRPRQNLQPSPGFPTASPPNPEHQYIDYLFKGDRSTADMLKRVSNMMTSNEQAQSSPTTNFYERTAQRDQTFAQSTPQSYKICTDKPPAQEQCRAPCAPSSNLNASEQQKLSGMKPPLKNGTSSTERGNLQPCRGNSGIDSSNRTRQPVFGRGGGMGTTQSNSSRGGFPTEIGRNQVSGMVRNAGVTLPYGQQQPTQFRPGPIAIASSSAQTPYHQDSRGPDRPCPLTSTTSPYPGESFGGTMYQTPSNTRGESRQQYERREPPNFRAYPQNVQKNTNQTFNSDQQRRICPSPVRDQNFVTDTTRGMARNFDVSAEMPRLYQQQQYFDSTQNAPIITGSPNERYGVPSLAQYSLSPQSARGRPCPQNAQRSRPIDSQGSRTGSPLQVSRPNSRQGQGNQSSRNGLPPQASQALQNQRGQPGRQVIQCAGTARGEQITSTSQGRGNVTNSTKCPSSN